MPLGKCKLKQQHYYKPISDGIQNADILKYWPGYGAIKISHSFLVGDAKLYRYFGRQYGSFLRNQTYSYHMIQQLHSLVFTQMS